MSRQEITAAVPVVQDDDLGCWRRRSIECRRVAERQRLQAAFGAYVDRFWRRGCSSRATMCFTTERREVTVMFVDIHNFTPFAEANSAEDAVARLDALFEIVVPAVVDAGGHVDEFLGDGALAVFGAPTSWPITPTPR